MIDDLYFSDICSNEEYVTVGQELSCYKYSNRALENGLSGLKEHLRSILQIFGAQGS
jgi:hypothetical protein